MGIGNSMKKLKIIKCSDPMLWYADRVGELVPYLGTWPEAYRSQEPAGYVNIVQFEDAELVEVEESKT